MSKRKANHQIVWHWRSREPARSPSNPAYPDGVTVLAPPGRTYCTVPLPYPAPGVGMWVVTCQRCGLKTVVTAAGRADDPRRLQAPCKEN